MHIYVDDELVRLRPDPDDPDDEFAALCRWVDSKPLSFWAIDPPYVTDSNGMVVRVVVSSSVMLQPKEA